MGDKLEANYSTVQRLLSFGSQAQEFWNLGVFEVFALKLDVSDKIQRQRRAP